jgi:hypothetical protein
MLRFYVWKVASGREPAAKAPEGEIARVLPSVTSQQARLEKKVLQTMH